MSIKLKKINNKYKIILYNFQNVHSIRNEVNFRF